MGVEMPQRRVARRALVFEFQLMVGVDGHLVGHLGRQKRILGAVRHERAHPLVCGIDVLASCAHIRKAGLVMTMASCAHFPLPVNKALDESGNAAYAVRKARL